MAQLDLKAILDDARARDAALLQLIIFTDRQAMALFRVYVTVGAAAAAASTTSLLGNSPLTLAGAIGASAIAIVIAIGAYFCLRAMVPSDVGLPGRPGEFWRWSMHDKALPEDVLAAYLDQVEAAQTKNRATNEKGAAALAWAKRLGIAAPFVGIAVAAVASTAI